MGFAGAVRADNYLHIGFILAGNVNVHFKKSDIQPRGLYGCVVRIADLSTIKAETPQPEAAPSPP